MDKNTSHYSDRTKWLSFLQPFKCKEDGSIVPFKLEVPQVALDDLARRLEQTRWPEAETVADWTQGVPLASMRRLVDHWRRAYNWRLCEAELNRWPQFRTMIEGLGIHFIHVRSMHANALPMIITHGWPGSVLEFRHIIGPLTDPTRHGGRAEDAFHLVIPSLPGYGLSDKPATSGWSVDRIACAWATLMARLGYDRFVAQGGDWGSAVTRAMAAARLPGLVGIHLNMVVCLPTQGDDLSDPEAREAIAVAEEHKRWGTGYSAQQSTRPQTLGYALTDSPVGQAAWIYEKFHAWTDHDGDPDAAFGRDAMLDAITFYWLTGTAASSARLYWESFSSPFSNSVITLPAACSIFPRELRRPPRRWAESVFTDIVYWNRPARGGHFAAFEQPALFVEEVRAGLRRMR